jgi:hypothetical protein
MTGNLGKMIPTEISVVTIEKQKTTPQYTLTCI